MGGTIPPVQAVQPRQDVWLPSRLRLPSGPGGTVRRPRNGKTVHHGWRHPCRDAAHLRSVGQHDHDTRTPDSDRTQLPTIDSVRLDVLVAISVAMFPVFSAPIAVVLMPSTFDSSCATLTLASI